MSSDKADNADRHCSHAGAPAGFNFFCEACKGDDADPSGG